MYYPKIQKKNVYNSWWEFLGKCFKICDTILWSLFFSIFISFLCICSKTTLDGFRIPKYGKFLKIFTRILQQRLNLLFLKSICLNMGREGIVPVHSIKSKKKKLYFGLISQTQLLSTTCPNTIACILCFQICIKFKKARGGLKG